MDWAYHVDWQALASFLNAIVIGVAAFIARKTYVSWQHERNALREAELAEDILAISRQAMRQFKHLRNPYRKYSVKDGESHSEAYYRDFADRMNNAIPVFQEILDLIPRVDAVFGEDVATSLEKFLRVRGELEHSLEFVIREEKNKNNDISEQQQARLTRHESRLYQDETDDDELWVMQRDALKELNSALLPIVRAYRRGAKLPISSV